MRRTPLKRRTHRKPAEATPERYAFKEVVWGHCEACGAVGWVRRHHVLYEQHCRAEGFPLFDADNAMFVGVDWTCFCHSRQHQSSTVDRRILLSSVPLRAKAFCFKWLGDERGRDYLLKHYRSAA